MKQITAILLALILCISILSGCKQVVSSGTIDAVETEPLDQQTEVQTQEEKDVTALLDINDIPDANLLEIDVDYQSAEPTEGEEVAILHTSMGDIAFRFFVEVAPKAVYSFKALAQDGRYDNTIFHRIIENFMIQGGDYTNFNGTGGVSAYGDGFGLEISDYLHNTRGAVAMANTGQPDSNGSQFYINQVDNNYLDGNYTVFGQVYDGMDVVDAIAAVDTDASDKPVEDVVLQSVEIVPYQG